MKEKNVDAVLNNIQLDLFPVIVQANEKFRLCFDSAYDVDEYKVLPMQIKIVAQAFIREKWEAVAVGIYRLDSAGYSAILKEKKKNEKQG